MLFLYNIQNLRCCENFPKISTGVALSESAQSVEAVRASPNECPGYDTKQSDDETLVMLEFWGMRSTRLLPSLTGPLWYEVVVPDRVLSMGQIELFNI